MDEEFDLEQEFLLARVYAEAQELSKTELIEALVGAVAQKLAIQQMATDLMAEHGIGFRLQNGFAFDPTDPDTLTAFLGYEPTEAEAEEYAIDAIEMATMELDMDAIVMAPEE